MSEKTITIPSASKSSETEFSEEIAELLAQTSAPKSTEGTSQSVQASGGGGKNNRKYYRHPVHWRVALVNKGGGKNDVYHGRTYDVSMSGISILLERNVFFTTEVVLLLAIPPMHQGMKEIIVEIQCSIAHTVLDSEYSQFRLGMNFIRFKENGNGILSDALSKRFIPKSEHSLYG